MQRYGENNEFHNTKDANIDLEETQPKTCGCCKVRSSHIPPPVDPTSMHVNSVLKFLEIFTFHDRGKGLHNKSQNSL
jgi:hypothetical protein